MMKTITSQKEGMVMIPGGVSLQPGENEIADKVWDDCKEHPAVKKMIDDKVLVEGKMSKKKEEEGKQAVADEKKTLSQVGMKSDAQVKAEEKDGKKGK